MGTRGRRILGGAGVLLGLAAAGGFLAAYLASPARDFATTSGLISGVLAALGFTVAVLALLPALSRTGGDPLETLALAVAREWEREAVSRGLDRPEPLRVRWGPTDRLVAEARVEESGDVTAIADVWSAHPARQLVILGEPGAGKTSAAVILVRRLLATRAQGDPVPVLLNVGDWEAGGDHLHSWLADKLVAHYGLRPAVTGELVDGGRIVPVLDGLDELRESVRERAIGALTDAVGMERPLVVTCRSVEYESLVRSEGAPLARAAVVEIRRVEAAEAVAYLPAGQIGGETRWRPVLDRLRDEPDGPLATALRTPLMVFLAREEYRQAETDPRELLALSDMDAIERELLTGYIPAIYRDPGPQRPGEKAPPDYPAADVERWLSFLARPAAFGDVGGFHWWGLRGKVRRRPAQHRSLRGESAIGGIAAGLLTSALLGYLVGANALPDVNSGLTLGVLVLSITIGLWIPNRSPWRARIWEDWPDRFLPEARSNLYAVSGAWLGLTLLGGMLTGAFPSAWHLVSLPVAFVAALIMLPWVSESANFHLATWQLSRDGVIPVRLIPFLEDAHRRGVMRKVGPAYQFRHARLAEHLAAQHLAKQQGPAAEAPGPSTSD
ncbi:NACHT domain-containing protein [Phytomonospora endophytica]|uniref:NACHT domain-containing protein n=1 Tax=Phytomonospora endophytica TaxID=714109 RepID=A0A841FM75_9ACTN|nr:hypothetical protein [Phytomonospora endophytica]MBB6036013.1 hypothetical protein [Phytomonospora endophytica]GIG66918.1 hypothetical protein Pen01_32130 [Phytomonospora endophytica]